MAETDESFYRLIAVGPLGRVCIFHAWAGSAVGDFEQKNGEIFRDFQNAVLRAPSRRILSAKTAVAARRYSDCTLTENMLSRAQLSFADTILRYKFTTSKASRGG